MTRTDRMRWSGVALLIAGVLVAVATVLHPDETVPGVYSQSIWATSHMVLFAGTVLALFGLLGLYAALADQGWLALGGFVLAFIGNVMLAAIAVMEAWIAPMIAGLGAPGAELLSSGPEGSFGLVVIASMVAFAAGSLLLGAAVLRSNILPKWAGILLAVGGITAPFVPPLPHVLLPIGGLCIGVAFVWLGYSIWMSVPQWLVQAQSGAA